MAATLSTADKGKISPLSTYFSFIYRWNHTSSTYDKSMFLAYMDECGNTGTYADPDQPIHFLGCLVVEDVTVRPLEEAVQSVAKTYFPKHWMNPKFEFHGVDLFGGKGFFKGTSVQHRIDATAALMAVASEHAAGFGYSGVNKLKSHAKEHPHRICFTLLAERLQTWLTSRDSLALLVSDENYEVEQDIISDIQTFKRSTTLWGYKRVAITRVIDSVHFVKSYNNPAIQLADVITFLKLKHKRTIDEQFDLYLKEEGGKPLQMDWSTWLDKKCSAAEKATSRLIKKMKLPSFSSKVWPD